MTEDTREAAEDLDGPCVFPRCDNDQSEHVSLPLCNWHIVKVHRYARLLIEQHFPPQPEDITPVAPKPEPATKPGVVYFIRLGGLIKIGFTTSLAMRLRDLPYEELLGIVPGTMRDEKALHQQFAHLRRTGEWFEMAPDLLEHIEAVAA